MMVLVDLLLLVLAAVLLLLWLVMAAIGLRRGRRPSRCIRKVRRHKYLVRIVLRVLGWVVTIVVVPHNTIFNITAIAVAPWELLASHRCCHGTVRRGMRMHSRYLQDLTGIVTFHARAIDNRIAVDVAMIRMIAMLLLLLLLLLLDRLRHKTVQYEGQIEATKLIVHDE